ncbi:MAG: DedA family protein, partial [Blastocatellia bacterium]
MSADMQVPPATPLLSGRLVGWTGAAVLFATTAALFTVAMTWEMGLSGATSRFQADAALFVQLAAATFVSEDLACIGAGVLVAHGRTSYALAASACFAGIFLGDLALFAAGRLFGRRLLRFPLVRRFVSERDVERSSAWLETRGAGVILASRFLPGTRLPTYVAAGILGTSAWRFTGAFALASAVWTPILVALAAWFGAEALSSALAAATGTTVAVLSAGLC